MLNPSNAKIEHLFPYTKVRARIEQMLGNDTTIITDCETIYNLINLGKDQTLICPSLGSHKKIHLKTK